MGWKKCRNCGLNPCKRDCAVQAYPGNPFTPVEVTPPRGNARPIGRDNDRAYQAAKERQDAEGRLHLARRLTADHVKDGVFDKMAKAGDVDLEKSRIGRDGGVVILKKGREGQWTDYE